MKDYLMTGMLLLIAQLLIAQISTTANDEIIPYQEPFGYGTNMGYYAPWTDEQLADIAAGNPAAGTAGVGINTLRPALFEWFLDQWGYEVRVATFQHYEKLGIRDNVVFLGFPAPQHLDGREFCVGQPSVLFKHLYDDIWDGGANGTPYNDKNIFAAYVYRTVETYQDYVRFWEIWNEPDLDHGGNGWKPSGMTGNWWDSDPNPCDLDIKAPVQHYVRMLRIAYEIIHTVDPDAYVAVGGLGYPSFLDAVLRNTDNPVDGSVSPDYPLKGGAYFDVLSYHSYPHIDDSMRKWSNDNGGFVYSRHSDAAVAGVLRKQDEFWNVLTAYGYDGDTYPIKEWIITECNLPRKAFGEYIGSAEVQRNFIIKTLVKAQANQIRQFHVYNLAESNTYDQAGSEFELMGLFQSIAGKPVSAANPNDLAIAHKSTADFLEGFVYSPAWTAKLQLNDLTDGGAFEHPDGRVRCILWAKTTQDRSESAAVNFTFPDAFKLTQMEVSNWDHAQGGGSVKRMERTLQLTGSPLLISLSNEPVVTTSVSDVVDMSVRVFPNPFGQQFNIHLEMEQAKTVECILVNSQGQQLMKEQLDFSAGAIQQINTPPGLPDGVYWLEVRSAEGQINRKKLMKVSNF